MTKRKDLFTRLLDQLSGTYPNDERTSRINEKGFALCGFFYIIALTVRMCYAMYLKTKPIYRQMPEAFFDRIVLGIMLLIMLIITLRQRRKKSSAPKAVHTKLRLTELPRAAAAFLSGKSVQDERTMHIYERGFAVCALIGIAYFGISVLLTLQCALIVSTFLLLCTAPVLLGYVKLRENILTPPRALHFRLNPNHLLLRLPIYLLIVLPFFFMANYLPEVYNSIGRISEEMPYSENLLIMFFQVIGGSIKEWLHHPYMITSTGWLYTALLFLIVLTFHEHLVWLFRKQMKQMDAEENDLS